LVALAATAGCGAWLVAHWGLVETDNAQLQGHLTEISSRVNGTIARVLVEDNQAVKRHRPQVRGLCMTALATETSSHKA
jgi:membrane fusion protein (multidrug efflux system)